MHILIINTVTLNGGDAAILLATIDLLRSEFGPETTFVVHDHHARTASRYYPDLTFRFWIYTVASRTVKWRWLRPAVRAFNVARFRAAGELWGRGLGAVARLLLTPGDRRMVADFAEADVVVATGGTYLVEHYKCTGHLFALEMARRLRRPLVFFTQSLGPFAKPYMRRGVGRAVDSAALVLLRDERSRGHLRELGARGDHLRVTADVVFASADAAAVAAARARGGFPPERAGRRAPRVAVSVRDWPHFRESSAEAGMAAYREAMAAAVTFLAQRYGARVTFLSTCQGIPEYRYNDARTAEEIAALLPPAVRASVDVDHAFHSPAELSALLREFDLVVATRMHMAIQALCVGTLVFPVAYEFKIRELFDRLGLGEFVHDIEGVDPERLVSSLGAFLNDASRIRDTTFAGVEREWRRATEAGALVRAALDGRLSREAAAVEPALGATVG